MLFWLDNPDLADPYLADIALALALALDLALALALALICDTGCETS